MAAQRRGAVVVVGATVKLPRFWRDRGTWNDAVVSGLITLSLLGWGALGWWLGLPWLMMASIVLGPVSGFLLGIGAVCLLCQFFAREDS